MLVRRGLIEPMFMYQFDGPFFIMYWEKYEPVFLGLRERFEAEPKGQLGEWQEDLHYVLMEARGTDHADLPSRLERRRLQRNSVEGRRASNVMKF